MSYRDSFVDVTALL